MEQKKREYVAPDMKVIGLKTQATLLDVSNDSEVAQAPIPCDTDRLA